MAPDAITAALPPGAAHQGIALRCSEPKATPLDDVLARPGPVVILDSITDPQNVGAIFRTALAFSSAGVVMQDRKAPPLLGACAKAAVGAADRLAFARVVNIARSVEAAATAGRVTVALDGAAQTVIGAATKGAPCALVMGAEGKGLRPSVANACAVAARIPIDPAMESLNVSAATAVALYAVSHLR